MFEANSTRLLCRLTGSHCGGVLNSVSFFPRWFAVGITGYGSDHTLCIWRSALGSWVDGKFVGSNAASKAKAFVCALDWQTRVPVDDRRFERRRN